MPTGTVHLHRVLRAKPEKIYRAFLEAEALARWLPPNGFTCRVDALAAKVGDSFHIAFRHFETGKEHAFGGIYLDLVPGERIRYTDRFDDGNLSGEMVTTVTLRGVPCGSELNVVQQGIPQALPPELCYLGGQDSLEYLARLVEPEIPD